MVGRRREARKPRRVSDGVSDAETAARAAAATRWRGDRRRRPRLAPNVISGLVGAIGVVAIVGGYLGSTAPNPLVPAATSRAPAVVPDATAVVRGAYQPELGPFALPWIWLSDRGSLAVQNASGRPGYVGLLAASLRRPRIVQVGDSPRRTVATAPRAYLIGPLTLRAGDIPIRVTPGAERASQVDRRRTSVFLSTPVVSHMPFAAIPGKGFYPREQSDARRFHWMTDRGVLDLVAPAALDGLATIRLLMWSPAPRRVRIERCGA